MPREALSKQGLLDHILKLPHGRATFKQLVRELGSRGWDRSEIEDLLDQLVERGELVEVRSGHFISTRGSREYTTGKLSMHRDGYGFVIADHPIEGIRGDLYIPREAASSAMHGDRVVARIVRVAPDGRADGEILKVLRRGHPAVVGEFRVRPRGNFVIPHDERIRQWIEIPEGSELPETGAAQHRVGVRPVQVSSAQDLDGMIVNAEILDFLDGGERVTGKVIEILGHPDDFGVDVEIMIRKHHIPHRFPADVIEQAQNISQVVPSTDLLHGGQDFRNLDIVTIDGETARDFDDAVWVDRLADGGYALQVHIADVSHYVKPGTPIDQEAFLRGTSVYFPDRAVPMLPLELSTEICSLKPGVDRLVLSVLLEIDHRGDIVQQKFTRGMIRSVERMTYTSVHLLLEGDAGMRDRYAPLVGRFEMMRELALNLNRKRVKRGSIDFDMPEPLIEFDEFGQMTGVTRSDRNIAHRIIEEFMLAANEAVASHLEQAGIASLFRIHDKPEAKRVMDFEEIAASFGYSLGIGGIPVKKYPVKERGRDGRIIRKEIVMASESLVVSSRNYQKLVAKIEGKPEERILTYLMLRSLKQARYSDQNKGHFALAAPSYTHFTSPIRRYPDLIVHRILGAFLDNKRDFLPQDRLHAIGNECSETERRAAEAERELVEWKKAKFMEDRVGEDFSGLIISTTRFGFFVELESLFIEGLVPIDTLPGDKYGFSENTRKIIGERSRRQFSIGDQVHVRLDRVDAIERKLQFGLVEPETRRKPKRRK